MDGSDFRGETGSDVRMESDNAVVNLLDFTVWIKAASTSF